MTINIPQQRIVMISDMDLEKKRLQLEAQFDPSAPLSESPEVMYGTEMPFYFLYKDGGDAEGVRGIPARLLDMAVHKNSDHRPYFKGNIAVKSALVGFHVVLTDLNLAIIQVETPNDEMHHAIAQLDEVDKIYMIIKEWNEAGQEITIHFHAAE